MLRFIQNTLINVMEIHLIVFKNHLELFIAVVMHHLFWQNFPKPTMWKQVIWFMSEDSSHEAVSVQTFIHDYCKASLNDMLCILYCFQLITFILLIDSDVNPKV